MRAMPAISIEQRHSRRSLRETEKRGADSPQYSRSTSSSFKALAYRKEISRLPLIVSEENNTLRAVLE
jgi:hypothetical protein